MKFNQRQIKNGKILVAVAWMLALAATLFPAHIPFSNLFIGIGAFLVVTHIIEIAVFNKRLKLVNDYIGVFFYGALHLNQLAINYKKSQL